MSEPLYFEQLRIGDRWKTRARTITETDVINFAGLTGDYDPLHVDREFAKQTPFGQPIAHGLLGLSFVAGLGSHFPAVQTVAFVSIQNWQFLLPAFIGDTVHAVIEITHLKDSSRRRGTVLWRRQLVNQKGEVVQQGTFETLVAKMPPGTVRKEPPAERARPKGRKSTSKPKKPSQAK
jgi:3-hydroxybutyryl-CoA dehydratase